MEEDTWLCPFCSYELKKDAHFCPNCGSDGSTGWADDGESFSDDLQEHDYEFSRDREFGGDQEIRRMWRGFRTTVAVLLIIILLGVLLSVV
ncbi:MAG: zinc ribbon domain-containing protein [Fibrobacterota bacterium]